MHWHVAKNSSWLRMSPWFCTEILYWSSSTEGLSTLESNSNRFETGLTECALNANWIRIDCVHTTILPLRDSQCNQHTPIVIDAIRSWRERSSVCTTPGVPGFSRVATVPRVSWAGSYSHRRDLFVARTIISMHSPQGSLASPWSPQSLESHGRDPTVIDAICSWHERSSVCTHPRGPWLLPGRHSPSSLMGGLMGTIQYAHPRGPWLLPGSLESHGYAI